MLREAKELGFLSGQGSALSFQPLLRAFVRRKNSVTAQHKETEDRLVAFLLESEEWDEAFDVIRDARQSEALLRLFELAHEALLKSGRTATLREWLVFAGSTDVHAPLLDLIRAELAIREGTSNYAEQLALRVAEQTEDRSAISRALSIAGRAAHLDNREAAALAHFGLGRNSLLMIVNATTPLGEYFSGRRTLRMTTSWELSLTPSSDMAPTAPTTWCEQQPRKLHLGRPDTVFRA